MLMANNETELQDLLDKVNSCSNKYGLKMTIPSQPCLSVPLSHLCRSQSLPNLTNVKKTKAMIVCKNQESVNLSLKIGNEIVEQVQQFQYLGTLITSDGRCEKEVKARIGQAETQLTKMRKFLSDRKVNIATRKRMLNVMSGLHSCMEWRHGH